jgi:hypothetical protein
MKTTVLETKTALAIGWPGTKDGMLIALKLEKTYVEDFPKSPEITLQYRFIDEFESEDMGKLIQSALEWQQKYNASTVYARGHKPALNFLESFNRDAYRNRTPYLTITEPPHTENQDTGVKGVIDYHLARLAAFLEPGREKLFDLPGTRLMAHLSDIPADSVNIRDRDFPGPAALAYALCGLELTVDSDREERELWAMEEAEVYLDD